MQSEQHLESFKNKRNQNIVWAQYKPKNKEPIAIYFFHSGYPHIVSIHTQYFYQLAEQGLWVFNFEHHGHARSEPKKPNNLLLESYRHLVDDSLQFIDETVIPEAKKAGEWGKLPLFIGGESMGGLATCLNALELKDRIKGFVILAPAIGVRMDTFHTVMMSVAAYLNKLVPKMRQVSVATPEKAFRDQNLVKVANEDPYMDPGLMRVRTAYELTQGMKYLEQHEHEIQVPVLILFGTEDKICDPEPSRRFFNKIQSKDKEFKMLPGSWHALIAQPDSEISAKATYEWIEKHVKTQGSSSQQ